MSGDETQMRPARKNLTARAAGWSARNRWVVVLAWLGLVFGAYAIGSAVGVVQMTSADGAIGESGVADRVLAREFPNERAGSRC